MSDEHPLLIDTADGVRTLRLNRPEARNAISWALRRALLAALRDTQDDPEVRVVVLRGDERAFCAGGDVKEMGGGRADDLAKLAMAKQVVTTIAEMPQPVVAVVRGHAAGAGFSLALGCDLVLADDTARFTAPFLARGLVPDMGAGLWLARHVGLMRAKEILLTGRAVETAEAVALGIVSRRCPAAELDALVDEVVTALAATSVTSLGLTKRLLNQTVVRDLGPALDAEQVAQAIAADTRPGTSPADRDHGPTGPRQEAR